MSAAETSKGEAATSSSGQSSEPPSIRTHYQQMVRESEQDKETTIAKIGVPKEQVEG